MHCHVDLKFSIENDDVDLCQQSIQNLEMIDSLVNLKLQIKKVCVFTISS